MHVRCKKISQCARVQFFCVSVRKMENLNATEIRCTLRRRWEQIEEGLFDMDMTKFGL